MSDVESSVEPLDHIIDRYAGTIHPDSERVQQLEALARCARQNELRILFFVPPVDHEYCKAHYGDAFTERLRRNVTTLRGVLSDEGFELLDLSESLSSAHFAHDGRPDEHLTEGGRQSLARSLARQLDRSAVLTVQVTRVPDSGLRRIWSTPPIRRAR